jgi:hypothetical protein
MNGGRLGFVVSHPFARKEAKGWGTELLWNPQPFICVQISPPRVNVLRMTGPSGMKVFVDLIGPENRTGI